MYNKDSHDNELIAKDLVKAFFELSGTEIYSDDKNIKINELDETDPVFQEVLKFYNSCKAKPKVKDMLV